MDGAAGDEAGGDGPDRDRTLPVTGLERHKRKTVILKPHKAIAAYREMLFYYGIKTVAAFLEKSLAGGSTFEQTATLLAGSGTDSGTTDRVKDWVNLGGQIVPAFRLDSLRKDIRERKITSWEEIHAGYEAMAAAYDKDRACHAWAVLVETGCQRAKPDAFKLALEKAVQISGWIKEQVGKSREKDFADPFRSITYRNKEEMEQVAGNVKDNPFIKLAEENHRRFAESAEALMAIRGS
jgi:hypothetical protein